MAFYDFLLALGHGQQEVDRLNLRYEHIIEPLRSEIVGSRVLDLGSHDGRWPYAFAAAGARSVVGIEGRADLVGEYATYPESDFKDRVELVVGDFIEGMERFVAAGQTFDIVACLGVFYHTMHHYRMVLLMAALRPRIIVIDSPFSLSADTIINVRQESTGSKFNSIALARDQSWIPVGEPSLPAMRWMAESVGYAFEPVEWKVAQEKRKSVAGYFRETKSRRFTMIGRSATAP
jgi:hypothetical protein